MRDAIKVFAAQFVYIMLLGLQQLNVVGSKYVGAMVVSLLLGMFSYQLTATIALNSVKKDRFVWVAYLIGGPLGIVTSMTIFPTLAKWYGG